MLSVSESILPLQHLLADFDAVDLFPLAFRLLHTLELRSLAIILINE